MPELIESLAVRYSAAVSHHAYSTFFAIKQFEDGIQYIIQGGQRILLRMHLTVGSRGNLNTVLTRLTDPTHVFVFYDNIEQYCEKEIIAPLIDMNRQIRCAIDAYANKKTIHTDKLWVFQIKQAFGYSSGNVQTRFGISDRKNPLKRRYVSYYSPKHDRNIDLAESDIDLRISRLRSAIIPLPNLRNTKDVLWCIGMMQTSILEEDDELRNFNDGT